MKYYNPRKNKEMYDLYLKEFANNKNISAENYFQPFVAGYLAAKKEIIKMAKGMEVKHDQR